MITIKANKGFKNALRLTGEWEERMKTFALDLTYMTAMFVFEEIKSKIPRDEKWRPYSDSLRVAKVTGLDKSEAGFVVYSSLIRRKIRDVDADKAVLYVQARRRLKRVPPAVLVLEKFSPWTATMIPFLPKKSEATIVSRRVRVQEAQQVDKDRKRDERKWKDALAKAGFRDVDKKLTKELQRGVETIPDLAFEALRLEFGIGGAPTVPHWRPALRKLQTELKQFATDSHLKDTFSDPSYRGWETPLGDSERSVSKTMLERFEDFQKALRVSF